MKPSEHMRTGTSRGAVAAFESEGTSSSDPFFNPHTRTPVEEDEAAAAAGEEGEEWEGSETDGTKQLERKAPFMSAEAGISSFHALSIEEADEAEAAADDWDEARTADRGAAITRPESHSAYIAVGDAHSSRTKSVGLEGTGRQTH